MSIFLFLAISYSVKLKEVRGDTAFQNVMEGYVDFKGPEIILPSVHKLPEYPGGREAWHKFIRSEFDIRVPFAHRAISGTYHLMIRMNIRNEGKVRSVGADTNSGYGLEAEMIRVISKSGDWAPAETLKGDKVGYHFRIMISITVKQNDVIISFPKS